MAKTLTSANAVLILAVAGLFDVPQRLQGFAADDVYDVDSVDTKETQMGVDGRLSAGWVPVSLKQNITLQADSPSMFIFESWYQAENIAREAFIATGSIVLPATGNKYVMTRGFLRNYTPAPAAKKILQPRKFTIEWERITGAPF